MTMPADLDELETVADIASERIGIRPAETIRAAIAEIREHREAPDYRMILLQLMASLTLADHMGDAGDAVGNALKRMGLEVVWDDWPDLARALHKMGVTTLYGTEIGGDEDEDADAE